MWVHNNDAFTMKVITIIFLDHPSSFMVFAICSELIFSLILFYLMFFGGNTGKLSENASSYSWDMWFCSLCVYIW